MIDKQVVCNIGKAYYYLDTALNNDYSISDEFYYAVKNLPASYNIPAYLSFIQQWGTVSNLSYTMAIATIICVS